MTTASLHPVPAEDVRDAFFGEVFLLAQADSRVMVLTDDQGAFGLDRIRDRLPEQYVNVGIAEQNLINVAAGLALAGMRPFVCGISNFMSLRCCEQISVNLSAMNLPVTIVASGGGLTYASDGPTHHSVQDVALIRTMPHFTIFNPSDAYLTSACARMCHSLPGPAYVRLEKGVLPALYAPGMDLQAGFGLLRQGADVLLVSTGVMTHTALKVAGRLNGHGIAAGVLDLFRLKPLEERGLLAHLRSARAVVVLEEQTPIGGVGSMVCELLAEASVGVPLRRFHLPDAPCYRYGSRAWLHQVFGLDETTLECQIAAWFRSLNGAAAAHAQPPHRP